MGIIVREKPKGSGIWWVFIHHDNKRQSKKIGPDKSLAKEVAKKIRTMIAQGEFTISTAPLFKEYAEHWLNDYVKELRRHSTYERYGEILKRHVYPTLGNKRIDKINRGMIRNLLLSLHKKDLSKSTLSLVRDAINGPMSYALDEELVTANPVLGITKRLNLERDRRKEVHPFNGEEVTLFLDTCKDGYPGFYPFFLCAFRTGMRLGELLGIQWGDVDFNSRFIEVKRSYRRGIIGPTKTGKTRRVDMSNQLTEALKMLSKRRKREALRDGMGEPVETIFHRDGEPMDQKFIRRQFKRILRKAGFRDMRFHDIRHTYASLLLTQGESLVYVKEQMGHHSIQVTVDIYGHLIPSSNREAVNRLDSATPKAALSATKNRKG